MVGSFKSLTATSSLAVAANIKCNFHVHFPAGSNVYTVANLNLNVMFLYVSLFSGLFELCRSIGLCQQYLYVMYSMNN